MSTSSLSHCPCPPPRWPPGVSSFFLGVSCRCSCAEWALPVSEFAGECSWELSTSTSWHIDLSVCLTASSRAAGGPPQPPPMHKPGFSLAATSVFSPGSSQCSPPGQRHGSLSLTCAAFCDSEARLHHLWETAPPPAAASSPLSLVSPSGRSINWISDLPLLSSKSLGHVLFLLDLCSSASGLWQPLASHLLCCLSYEVGFYFSDFTCFSFRSLFGSPKYMYLL